MQIKQLLTSENSSYRKIAKAIVGSGLQFDNEFYLYCDFYRKPGTREGLYSREFTWFGVEYQNILYTFRFKNYLSDPSVFIYYMSLENFKKSEKESFYKTLTDLNCQKQENVMNFKYLVCLHSDYEDWVNYIL